MNAQKTQFLTGTVERTFKPRTSDFTGGYTTVLVPGLDRQLSISDDAEIRPYPGLKLSYSNRSILPMPDPGDQVDMEVSVSRGFMKVLRWAYSGVIYRVKREDRFKGQMMPKPKKTEDRVLPEAFFQGNLVEMVSLYPRDGRRVSTQDKLAPIYKTGPLTAKHRFELSRDNAHTWAACDDPRPFPKDQIYRLTFWKGKGSLEQLALGTAAEIESKFPAGKNDPLIAYRNDATTGEGHGYLYWERYEKFAPAGQRSWTEVSDPRTLYDKVPSCPTTLPAKKLAAPVKMAKRSRRDGFSMTVNGFEKLGVEPVAVLPVVVSA